MGGADIIMFYRVFSDLCDIRQTKAVIIHNIFTPIIIYGLELTIEDQLLYRQF